ncbi:unnamed protein product [Heligmosomoides polygyrus]|uniref:Uncharacterized protein n=1 Tax=Heligmosomoides polygyrus TaxID=6339 RepID=A0A183G958_HELPZ|nr:unnamed protein product [Heligmosomoides polygyrus]
MDNRELREQLRDLRRQLREIQDAIPPLPDPLLYDRIVTLCWDNYHCTLETTRPEERLRHFRRTPTLVVRVAAAGEGDVITENAEFKEELQIDDAEGNNAADDDAEDGVEVDPHAEKEGLDARENAGDVANEAQQDAQMLEERHNDEQMQDEHQNPEVNRVDDDEARKRIEEEIRKIQQAIRNFDDIISQQENDRTCPP